jgi:uncharacterized protein (DUF885 family)
MTTVTQLADELVDAVLDQEPISATLLGMRDRDDRLTDYRAVAEEEFVARVRGIAARAEALDPAGLSPDDRITRLVVAQGAEAIADQTAARDAEYAIIDSFTGPAARMLIMLPMIGISEPEHADGYLARLDRIPEVLAALADRHREGLAAGRVPVRRLVESAVSHLDRYLAGPEHDPLRRPAPPADGPVPLDGFESERDRLLDQAVRPAYARYREVLTGEVLPHARPNDRPGLCWLPGGDEIYAGLVRAHTTTARSPEELHQTGLDIVAALTEEYAQIGSRVFGTTDFAEILTRLRTDPELRWNDEEELLSAARDVIRRAEEAAPRWFGRLPSHSCEVRPVPADEAPGAAAAYYVPAALDGSRPGIYFANTHEVRTRDRYTAEATAFHEAVPGHHFQLTVAQELTDLPLLRRIAAPDAYAEGWGLYTERLAEEMGLYSGDVARLGMLTLDSMRAVRLVVDTGLHAKGWSREQVVEYMRANSALPQVDIDSETDRYIASPGQALSYMVGRLEIQRIRAEAERALGDGFDIRAFHDVVLGNGALPLSVLDQVVKAWVAGGPGR